MPRRRLSGGLAFANPLHGLANREPLHEVLESICDRRWLHDMDVDVLSSRLVSELGSNRRLVVALDGPGGAGKSTIARRLRETCNLISIVHGDDFYAPMEEHARRALTPEHGYMKYFDWVRMRSELLEPLSRGDRARYQRYDWGINQLAEWIDQPAEGIILIDGVYSFRPELRGFYGYSIFVDTPKGECLARLVKRGDADEWIRRWRAAEDYYLTHIDTASAVSVVVSGAGSA